MVKDINPASWSADFLYNVNGTFYFQGNDFVHGWELWTSDGTEAGTKLLKNINPGGASTPLNLTSVNGTLFFMANDGEHGYEIWKSNGTADGTVLFKDLNPGANGSFPDSFTYVNGTLFLAADDGVHGAEIWALPRGQRGESCHEVRICLPEESE